MLPEEYLPDDYDGAHAGTIQEICSKCNKCTHSLKCGTSSVVWLVLDVKLKCGTSSVVWLALDVKLKCGTSSIVWLALRVKLKCDTSYVVWLALYVKLHYGFIAKRSLIPNSRQF